MVTETGVELVEAVCPRCGYRWTCSYEVVHCELPGGAVADYFSIEGLRAPSPYAPGSAPPCLRCARRSVARFIARRTFCSTEAPGLATPVSASG